jgi:hypothetical protein
MWDNTFPKSGGFCLELSGFCVDYEAFKSYFQRSGGFFKLKLGFCKDDEAF